MRQPDPQEHGEPGALKDEVNAALGSGAHPPDVV